MTKEKRIKIYQWLTIAGFAFAVVLSELAKFFSGFQILLSNLIFATPVILLRIVPLITFVLWAKNRQNRDVWRSVIALLPSILIVYLIQYIAPAVGWWTGISVSLMPLLQSILYGTALIGLIIGAISWYRVLRKKSKVLAVIYYLAILVLVVTATYYLDLYQSSLGLITFTKGYTIYVDLLYKGFVFFLPWLIYELLNYFTITEKELSKDLDDALDRINSAIHSTLDFDEVMKRVIKEAASALGAESSALAIREDGYWSGRYQIGLLKGARPRLTDIEARNAEFGLEMTAPLGINDVFKNPKISRDIVDKYHFRSMMAIPLETRGDFIGVLTFNYHTHKVIFTEDQMSFAAKLQTTLSLALQNARLFGSEKEIANLNDSLNRINTAISSTRNIDEIMSRAIEESAKAIGCETAGITLHEDDHWVLRYNYGFSKEYLGMRFSEQQAKETLHVSQTREPLVSNDALNDDRLNIETVKALRVRSVVVVPLAQRERIVGVLSYNYHRDAIAFTGNQVDFLRKVAVSLSLAIENAHLYANQRDIADTLQKVALEMPETVPGIEFSHLYRSSTTSAEVGGDFYDIFKVEQDKIGFLIGDVSGKGLQAATLTSLIKNTIKAYALENDSPSKIVAKTNEVLIKGSPSRIFVTLFFGIIEINTGKIKYCSAGHPPIILKKSSSEITFLAAESPVTGILPDVQFGDEEITLEIGDTLILYTDGVTEARSKGELFGDQRLADAVADVRSVKEMPQYILDRVIQFSGNNLVDDIAILALALKEIA